MEVMSPCPTYFGRKNRLGTAINIMQWQKDHAVPVNKAAELTADELSHRFITGVLVDRELPIYLDQYERIANRAKAKRDD